MKAMLEALRDSLENLNKPIPVSGAANWAREVFKRCEKTRSKKVTYMEVPASFDIEASSAAHPTRNSFVSLADIPLVKQVTGSMITS